MCFSRDRVADVDPEMGLGLRCHSLSGGTCRLVLRLSRQGESKRVVMGTAVFPLEPVSGLNRSDSTLISLAGLASVRILLKLPHC